MCSIFLTCQINIFIQVFAEQGNVPNIIIAVSKALIFNNIDSCCSSSKINLVMSCRFLVTKIQNCKILLSLEVEK